MAAAAAATAKDSTGHSSSQCPVEPGKVSEVRNQWLLHGDEGLAYRLQSEEFGAKSEWNRADRKTARTDVPLARIVQTEEELQLQKQQLEHLERERQRAENDARLAMQLEKEDRVRRDLDRIAAEDSRLAQQIQHEESEHIEMIQDDAAIALQLQKEELLRKRNEMKQRELEDQNLARRLQKREQQLAEMARIERELRQQQYQSVEPRLLLLDAQPGQGNVLHRQLQLVGDDDIQQPGTGYFHSFCEQDQAIAHAMQSLEIEQARAARERVYDIASSDARLARILQEQEKLKTLRSAQRLRRLELEQPALIMQQDNVLLVPREDVVLVPHEYVVNSMPVPPPYEPTPMPARYHYVERNPSNRLPSAGSTNQGGQMRAAATYVQPRPTLQSNASVQQLPSDFLRVDDPSPGRLENVTDFPPDRRDRLPGDGAQVYRPAARAMSVEDQRSPAERRDRPKRAQSTKGNCKQQ